MDPRNRQNQSYKQGRDNQLEEKQFNETVVTIDRVARVVKGGRRFRFRALMVVGDGKGQVGVGVSKGQDVQAAIQKATEVAKKNIVKIDLYKQTIPHETEAKVSGAHIWIKPAAKGTGLKAGGVVRTVLEAVGVRDILSKSIGSSNKINSAYATIEALESLVGASKWVTRSNDKKKPAKKATTAKTETSEPAPKKATVKKEAK